MTSFFDLTVNVRTNAFSVAILYRFGVKTRRSDFGMKTRLCSTIFCIAQIMMSLVDPVLRC